MYSLTSYLCIGCFIDDKNVTSLLVRGWQWHYGRKWFCVTMHPLTCLSTCAVCIVTGVVWGGCGCYTHTVNYKLDFSFILTWYLLATLNFRYMWVCSMRSDKSILPDDDGPASQNQGWNWRNNVNQHAMITCVRQNSMLVWSSINTGFIQHFNKVKPF